MSPLRKEIIAALQREQKRLQTDQRGSAPERHALIASMLSDLESERGCFMKIERELRPQEIKL